MEHYKFSARTAFARIQPPVKSGLGNLGARCRKLRLALKLASWRNLRATFAACPLCRTNTPFIKLDNNLIAIRCTRCRASAITCSLVCVLNKTVPELENKSVYELSSRGSLYDYLKRESGRLVGSEYYDDIALGQTKNGVLCQNVECLTFPDQSFDVCTSTEVFEHVADDRRGFSEIYRVLKRGGVFVFTVPLGEGETTRERARRLASGEIEYMLPAEYHGDQIRGWGKVLVYRDYGRDIVSRLRSCGFGAAEIHDPSALLPWKQARLVVVGYKH
ncbi:MAG TPA: methyltransferase domain-containing protein [Nitrococcus sp.]|nr:methyltransferase domain-containing protein [Nitrococcus sp.]